MVSIIVRTKNEERWIVSCLNMVFAQDYKDIEVIVVDNKSTDKTVEKLARDGVKTMAVFNPGFVSDCLETLEEIAGEVADAFRAHGGEKFSHIPCLNASKDGMKVIETVVRNELQGWV